MSTPNKLARKSSYEEFYYADILDSSHSSASKFLSMQFDKMRENLASAGFETPRGPITAPSSAEKSVKFISGTDNSLEQANRNPPVKYTAVPSHIVPKRSPVLKNRARSSSPTHRLKSLAGKAAAVKQTASSPTTKEMGVNPVVVLPERPDLVRTLGTNGSFRDSDDAGAMVSLNTFRGVKMVKTDSFREEVHLHHDVFLATHDEGVSEAVHSISRRRQEVVSRYAHCSGIDYTIKPETKNVKCTVPSHVVRPRSTERSRSAPRGSGVRGGGAFATQSTVSGANTPATAACATGMAVPMLQLSSLGGAESTSYAYNNNTSSSDMPLSSSPLNVKQVALNPSLYKSGSKSQLHGTGSSTSSLLPDTRFSPVTVNDLSPLGSAPAVTHASPVIKQQRKKFDFTPSTPSTQNTQRVHTTPPSFTRSARPPPVTAPTKGLTNSNTTSNNSNKHTNKLSPARATTTTTASSITKRSVSANPRTRPGHHLSQSQTLGQSQGQGQGQGATTTSHYRPLTAAEHAAAVSLSTKLNAANLAYHRTESVDIQPVRKMSRALSQLVYNVR